jgi:hypothetical protein
VLFIATTEYSPLHLTAMKWKRLSISAVMLMCALHMTAGDSIDIKQSKYEKRMQRMQNTWAALIPSHYVIQNAGNMGIVSIGTGWSYGKHRQWETDLLFGYIPQHESTRGKLTMTVKENYIPWDINLSPKKSEGKWQFEPLTASLYLNTVYGHEFWKSQPGRYPDKYYQFMSTKFRLNFALGQRIMFKIPESKRRRHSRMSLFYEVSTCDLYIRSMFQDSSIKLKDILGLSIGLKFYTL